MQARQTNHLIIKRSVDGNFLEPLTVVSTHHYNTELVPSEEINVGDCLLYVGEV
jgi:hypothetical protein